MPCALVLTEPFVGIAKHAATKLGVDAPRLVVVDHPLGGLDQPAVVVRAGQAIGAAVDALGLAEGSSATAEIRAAAEAALEPVRSGFEADGAALVVASVDDEKVVVRLELRADDCAECVVGPDVLRDILADVLARISQGRAIVIDDPRRGHQ